MFAYCRSSAIKNIQYLQSQTRHARREDKSSQPRIRAGATPTEALTWVCDPSPDADQRDYLAAYKMAKKSRGVGERKAAQIGIHVIACVSPEWVREAGDLHDPANPRNREILDQAIAWANSWSNDGCYAARLDLDETGGAVVDLMIAPTAEQRHKSGKSKLTISVNKALEALTVKHGLRKGGHYAALNSDWAAYAQAHLDPRLQRGKPKSETARAHIPPDKYRAMMVEAEQRIQAVAEAEGDLSRRVADLERREADLVKSEGILRRAVARVRAVVEGLADLLGVKRHMKFMDGLREVEEEYRRLEAQKSEAVPDPFGGSGTGDFGGPSSP